MKLISTALVSISILLISAAVFAQTKALPPDTTIVPLAGITNDRDTSVSYLNLMVNGQAAVRGIYVETAPSGSPDAFKAHQAASDKVYPLKSIESRDGVVLGQGQGVKAILLRGTIDSRAGRGSLVIKYITNGIFMNYDECRVGLHRVARHNWELVNAYNGDPIKRIEVKTWLLGISTLANVCPDRTS